MRDILYIWNYEEVNGDRGAGCAGAGNPARYLSPAGAEGSRGLPAGEIGSRLGQPSPTMSFHLNQLRFAGLVTSRRESRSIIYSANFKAMNDLLGYLTENCCGGRPELCSPAVATAADPNVLPQDNYHAKEESEGICMKRFHAHVRVDDLESSVRFYSTLFGAEPAVLKADYAKWMLDDPRVNFAITAGSASTGSRSSRTAGRIGRGSGD